jgi:hypothetical protein
MEQRPGDVPRFGEYYKANTENRRGQKTPAGRQRKWWFIAEALKWFLLFALLAVASLYFFPRPH